MGANVESTIESVFALSDGVRYVAVYWKDVLTSRQRADVAGASSEQSDRYEELFVNPGILMLARQRGKVDCGGFHLVVIRYGNFYQCVVDLIDGHLSVCFDLCENPLSQSDALLKIGRALN